MYTQRFNNLYQLKYNTSEKHSTIKNKIRIMCNMKQLFTHKDKNDIIIVQSSATATALIGIFLFKWNKSTVYTIQYNTECVNSFLKRTLFNLAKRKINGIICPSKEIGEAYGIPYCVVPDYIYTPSESQSQDANLQKKYDFSTLGIICKDKGTPAMAKRLKNTSYRVLIAGKPQNEDIKLEMEDICRDSPNITLYLNYLPENEYKRAIQESRYCILNYSGAYSEHSSGVVFDLLYQNIPIIARRCRFLQFIEDYQLGYLYNDIKDFNFKITEDKDRYQAFIENIKSYQKKQMDYILKLGYFLKII